MRSSPAIREAVPDGGTPRHSDHSCGGEWRVWSSRQLSGRESSAGQLFPCTASEVNGLVETPPSPAKERRIPILAGLLEIGELHHATTSHPQFFHPQSQVRGGPGYLAAQFAQARSEFGADESSTRRRVWQPLAQRIECTLDSEPARTAAVSQGALQHHGAGADSSLIVATDRHQRP